MKNQTLETILNRLPEIAEAEAIPLFGNAPPFDSQKLSEDLGSRLDLKGFSLHPARQNWISVKELKEQLGEGFFSTSIFLSPLSMPFFFAISKADKNKLTAFIMEGKPKGQISDPLKEGFCKFLVLEAVAAASGIEPISKLTPSLGASVEFPEENVFCIDVEITFEDHSCWSKIIIPTSFQKAWVEHFEAESPQYRAELVKRTELIIGCQIGSVKLGPDEWKKIKAGDFVVLDETSYDLETKTSLCTLKLDGTPLFHAKIAENSLELMDIVFTKEETMEQETEKDITAMKNIPMTICVEIARLRISLDELMKLSPGNTIPLPIHPDQGVDLTVNGKKIGHAELGVLGDRLGIRILEV